MGKKNRSKINLVRTRNIFEKFRKVYSVKTILIVFFAIFLIVTSNGQKVPENYSEEQAEEITTTATVEEKTDAREGQEVLEAQLQKPEAVLLDIPFASQAPFGDWDQPYQDACEEASIIMIKYSKNHSLLSKESMKLEITQAVDWQIKNWGGHRDLNAKDTLKLAKDYFGLEGTIINQPTAEMIKEQLVLGHPITLPAAGRKLKNPNFRGLGPIYHMLVVRGFDNKIGKFITNDPGTRKGERYLYEYDLLIAAISGPEEDMAKEIIVF
jgi:hypothetical protein